MRFLMLNWRDPRNPISGGAERVSQMALADLVRRGHEVYWFAPEFPGSLPQEEIEGVRMVRAGKVGVDSIRQAILWYRQQPRFDLVIDQHHGIPWYAPWWCRTHCVAYIHEVLGPIWNSFYRWPWTWIGRTQERWTHWFYRRVPFWTVCDATRQGLLANGVRHVTVLYNGTSTVAIPELEPKTCAEPLRLAVVCRLAVNKRVDHAIAAVAQLRQAGVKCQLKIVGGGDIESTLRQQCTQLGLDDCVTFTGSLPERDKDAVLREAHLLLHASVREGWGLNVIEANAMGTPAVVYPVPGLTESTLHGKTGLVAETETPAALAQCVRRLLANPAEYQSLRRQAWERAKSMHWDVILPQTSAWLEARARGEALPPQ